MSKKKTPKKQAPKKKTAPGRPEIKYDLKQVEAYAAHGLNNKQIALCLGIHIDTLCVHKKKYSEFSEAIERGKALGVAKAAKALMSLIDMKDRFSIIFYLKTQGGWRETLVIEEGLINKIPEDLSTLSDDDLFRIRDQLIRLRNRGAASHTG